MPPYSPFRYNPDVYLPPPTDAGYVFKPFVPGTGMVWDRSRHRIPTPETDHIDQVLNALEALEASRPVITITAENMEKARFWSRKMRQDSKEDHARNFKVSSRSDVQIHFEGEQGQAAVSQWLGIPYEGRSRVYREADIPRLNIEVRTTTKDWLPGKVRNKDDDSRRVVVVLLQREGVGRIMGWIPAVEGKKYKLVDWRDAGLPYHGVPLSELWPVERLRELIISEGLLTG